MNDNNRKALILLKQAMEAINAAAFLIGADEKCLHENKINTTTMGAAKNAFYCSDCSESYVLIEERVNADG